MIYQWKPGARQGKLDAQAAGEHLEALRQTHGQLTAELTVEDARPVDALLHPAFEWDDSAAANEYRKEQARSLIRSVVVVSESAENKPPIRAFIVVSELGEQAYTSINIALTDPDMRQQVLHRALTELRQWEARYRELKELAKVFAAAREVREAA